VTVDDDAPPIEDRLRSALATGIETVEADAGPPTADPGDLARRRVAHHRRQRAGRAAAVAAVVLAAVAGGWALGRDGGGDVEQVTRPTSTTAASTTEADRDDGVVPVDGDLPMVAPVGQVLMGGGMESDAAALASLPDRVRPADDPWYEGALLPSAPLFTRTLDDGTVLTVDGNRYDPAIYELPTFWDPPPQCFPSGDVVVAAAGGSGEGRGVSTRFDAVAPGSMLVGAGVVGPGEDRWVAVAQGPPGTAAIRVTFPGGVSDEMAPVDGLAVLTAPTVAGVDLGVPFAGPPQPDLVAVALDADGDELARWEGPWSGVEASPTEPRRVPEAPFRRPDCALPTTLPPPGAEQPADPAAAEAAVRATWDGAFGRPGATPVADQVAAADDPRGLAEALEAVRTQNAPLRLEDDTFGIDGVVFAGPERAHVQYTHDPGVGQGLPTPGLFGELVLVDGRWRITRLSVCRIVTFAGGACPPIGAP
jgi:hypothetical protein